MLLHMKDILLVIAGLMLVGYVCVDRLSHHRGVVRASKTRRRLREAKIEVARLRKENAEHERLLSMSHREMTNVRSMLEDRFFGGMHGKLIAALGKELDEARKEIQRLRATPPPESRPQR